ncbi:MAG: hypothetical protein B6D55_07370, partial [Candidatus Omnitrophica bacterium 4484_70.2]
MNHHTLLGQILQMFPRFEFQKAVKETKTEYHARGFTSWNHLATNVKALYHLGIKPIHRSTLSYANELRSHELFKKIFFFMLSKCQPLAPKHKFRFKNPLYSYSGYLPSFAVITNGNVHEQKVAPSIPLEKGDVIAFDRTYNSLLWLKTLDNKGVFFIYSDQIIKLKGFYSKKKFPDKLRRIRSKDPETGKTVTLLTNNFFWSAKTIAKVYKERWQIELFFKTLKQQLKVKSFVGTSRNALLSQLWIALIAYLLLSYLK